MKRGFNMLKKLKALFVEEEGQGMTEYGLIIGLVAVVLIGVIVVMRGQIASLFTSVSGAITSGQSTGG